MHALVVSVLVILFLVIIRESCMVIYRLYFHPLAGIPGPKLAAATQWYEFYYDVLKWPGGQYWLEVDKMHDRYGKLSDLPDGSRFCSVNLDDRQDARLWSEIDGENEPIWDCD